MWNVWIYKIEIASIVIAVNAKDAIRWRDFHEHTQQQQQKRIIHENSESDRIGWGWRGKKQPESKDWNVCMCNLICSFVHPDDTPDTDQSISRTILDDKEDQQKKNQRIGQARMPTFYPYYVTKQQDYKFCLYAKHSQMFWCVYQHELSMLCAHQNRSTTNKNIKLFRSLFFPLSLSLSTLKIVVLKFGQSERKKKKQEVTRKIKDKKYCGKIHTQRERQCSKAWTNKLNHVQKNGNKKNPQ